MTLIIGTSTIALRMMITKYNGPFSGSTHTINNNSYIRVFLNTTKPLLLPFEFKGKKIRVKGLNSTAQVYFD